MHPSFSYEDFIQGIKPITNSSNLNFNLKDGVFKKVSDFAKTLYENEGELNVTSVNNKDILYICFFLSKFNTKLKKDANLYFGFNSNSEVYNYIGLKYNLKTNTIKNLRDAFDFLVSDSRTGWKPKNGSIDKLDNSDLWPFQDVYLELKDKSFDEYFLI
jgi:5-methylcytosine-specific restriction protein B